MVLDAGYLNVYNWVVCEMGLVDFDVWVERVGSVLYSFFVLRVQVLLLLV